MEQSIYQNQNTPYQTEYVYRMVLSIHPDQNTPYKAEYYPDKITLKGLKYVYSLRNSVVTQI